MASKVVKIADLAQLSRPVDISEDQHIMVRALNLREMVGLFVESRDVFLPLYAASLEGSNVTEVLAPFLLSAPEVVAKIIAMASDDPDSALVVEKNMAATVQLIALAEIWKVSVPDQKKARELLSEVTSLLQKLSERSGNVTPQTASQTSLQPR
jgi:hypothetical protein